MRGASKNMTNPSLLIWSTLVDIPLAVTDGHATNRSQAQCTPTATELARAYQKSLARPIDELALPLGPSNPLWLARVWSA